MKRILVAAIATCCGAVNVGLCRAAAATTIPSTNNTTTSAAIITPTASIYDYNIIEYDRLNNSTNTSADSHHHHHRHHLQQHRHHHNHHHDLDRRASISLSGQGPATYYGADPGDPPPTSSTPGACGPAHLPPNPNYFVALNSAQFVPYTPNGNPNNNALCGSCLRVTCADSRCIAGAYTTVYLGDMCPGCGPQGVDLSVYAFGDLMSGGTAAARVVGKITVSWQTVACPSDWNKPSGSGGGGGGGGGGGASSSSTTTSSKTSTMTTTTTSTVSAKPSPPPPPPKSSSSTTTTSTHKPSPSPPPPPPPPPPPAPSKKIIKCTKSTSVASSSDTCWSLGHPFRVSVPTIEQLNPSLDCSNLVIGAKVCVAGSNGAKKKQRLMKRRYSGESSSSPSHGETLPSDTDDNTAINTTSNRRRRQRLGRHQLQHQVKPRCTRILVVEQAGGAACDDIARVYGIDQSAFLEWNADVCIINNNSSSSEAWVMPKQRVCLAIVEDL